MAADEYIPCLKCDAWVPHYAKEIHMAECHELTLKQFTHPYITDSSLFGQVTFIGGTEQSIVETKEKDGETVKSALKNKKNLKSKLSDSNQQNKTEKIGNESQAAEPEWLKKILAALHYRAVLMNEKDLIRCNITAYTPVEVKAGSLSCGFLAIPERVRIGHLLLHQGSSQYLPELENHALIYVRKIDSVRYVDELKLLYCKTFTNEEKLYFEKQMKAFLYSSFPLGAPFTVNVGCKIYLPSLQRSDTVFTVQSFKLCESFCEEETSCEYVAEEQESITEKSDTFPSQLITIDECEGSVSSVTEKVSKLQISYPAPHCNIQLEKTANVTNFETNIFTSTPIKSSFEGSQHNQNVTFPPKISSKDISSISGLVSETVSYLDKVTPWVRIGTSTKIILQPMSVKKVDVHLHKAVSQEGYCKDQVYCSLKKMIQTALKGSCITDSPLLGRWSGVLLYGPPGTGKTLMVHEVAAELSVPVFTLTLATVSKSTRSTKDYVQFIFGTACQSAPSVLFIDEVESLCPATDLKMQADKTFSSFILQGIQMLQTAPKPVFLVAATCQPSQVSSKLRSPGRLERELMVPLPDAQQRQRIFHQLISTHHHDLNENDIASIAKKAYGFSGADLSVLIRCAWLACAKRIQGKEYLKLSKADVYVGMQNIIPTMLRHTYSAVSMVKWHDICGYQGIKMKLQKNIGLYSSDPEKYPLKGLLLYGPPGCSKTMFVRALVHETSYSFFPLKCSNLLSKYVGETEKLLSQVFIRAQQAAPSVVFMDEVDSLCGERGGGGSLVSELLSLMSQTAVQRNIMVIGATNRPHAVDEALLRPGFLEQVIHVDLPDFETRCEIWRGVLEGVPQEGILDIAKLSEATTGYSGAEITALYQEASFTALDRYIKLCDQNPKALLSQSPISLNEDLLMMTIASIPPRTPISLLDSIAAFTSQRNDCLSR
ncbi:ATPase family protein 2 homolog isoform X2 [Portunus trituberculatus]|uniref:ATPase family protein 2 homolog isoform X2 n=1 Tax=Portunus trituberculatus TaxID=210409 RepID=UPI001E1CCBAE|nr:ATPase family protein 2 homolog isoform X2 [Portunus trituberculatus]XP_045131394.1 ATPase family protein 2 homolog isoform X2 [Portunus trituberculatus]